MRALRILQVGIFILATICGSANHVFADEVLKHGVRFQVDEIRDFDTGNKQVSVLGKTVIIGKDSVEDFVIKQYFSEAGIGKLSKKTLQDFIQAALDDHAVVDAAGALRSLLKHPESTELETVEFLSELPESEDQVTLYKSLLIEPAILRESPDVLGMMAFVVAHKDVRWLKTKGVRNLYLNGDAVKRYFKSRFYRDLERGDLEAIAASLLVLKELFGSDDEVYSELNVIFIKLKQGLDAIDRLDAEGMLSLLDLTQSNEVLARVLPSVIVQSVHKNAQIALNSNNAGKALTLLSWLDLDWRTPTTHALVADSLAKLKPNESSNVIGTRIEKFLAFIAGKDPLVQKAYASFLERDLRRKVIDGHFGQVEPYFERLTLVRPDPNTENDALRVFCVVRLHDGGYPAAAAELYGKVQTSLSLVDTYKLLSRGIMVDLTILICAICIPLLLILWLLLRRIPDKEVPIVDEVDPLIDEEFLNPEPENEDQEGDDQPVFAAFVGRSRDPVFLSYQKQLRKFKLEPDTALKDIKHAYRQAIKEVHPDINPDVDEKDRERFLDLTNAYEKILKLRERLGYPMD